MSTYAEGFMHGVAQATNSSISIDDLYAYGAKKAMDTFSKSERNPIRYPFKPQINEYDKGWYDGIVATLANIQDNEITVDTESPDYIPLIIIKKIIESSYNREIKSLKKQSAMSKHEEQIKREKERYNRNKNFQEAQFDGMHEPHYNQKSIKKSYKDMESAGNKLGFNSKKFMKYS